MFIDFYEECLVSICEHYLFIVFRYFNHHLVRRHTQEINNKDPRVILLLTTSRTIITMVPRATPASLIDILILSIQVKHQNLLQIINFAS